MRQSKAKSKQQDARSKSCRGDLANRVKTPSPRQRDDHGKGADEEEHPRRESQRNQKDVAEVFAEQGADFFRHALIHLRCLQAEAQNNGNENERDKRGNQVLQSVNPAWLVVRNHHTGRR